MRVYLGMYLSTYVFMNLEIGPFILTMSYYVCKYVNVYVCTQTHAHTRTHTHTQSRITSSYVGEHICRYVGAMCVLCR